MSSALHSNRTWIGSILTRVSDKSFHAKRRKMSSAVMSRGNVHDLHDLVASKMSMLLDAVARLAREQTPVNIYNAWRSFTIDVISTFAFGHSLDALDRKDFDHEMLSTLESSLAAFYIVSRPLERKKRAALTCEVVRACSISCRDLPSPFFEPVNSWRA